MEEDDEGTGPSAAAASKPETAPKAHTGAKAKALTAAQKVQVGMVKRQAG